MKKLVSIAILLSLMASPSFAYTLLAPGDAIIAIDTDGPTGNSGYPGGENPSLLLDGNSGTKYLNFGGSGSGFIVTPSSSQVVQSFVMTTANDAADRDPTSWELYGTNDAITSGDNSQGLNENWTLIDSGSLALPGDRQVVADPVAVSNSVAYSLYRMVYPQNGGSNLFQLADIELRNDTGSNILLSSDPVLGIHSAPDSKYPGAESPMNLIDGTLNKYLNFGGTNSGVIVTPGVGPSIVDSMQVTTANDSPERDPMVWIMYGTNDAIVSEDNSQGDAENWTLISAGTMLLTDDRDTESDIYDIAVDQFGEFTSYKIIFPVLKNIGAANSMQLAELQLYGIPEPATICLLGLGGLSLLRRRRK